MIILIIITSLDDYDAITAMMQVKQLEQCLTYKHPNVIYVVIVVGSHPTILLPLLSFGLSSAVLLGCFKSFLGKSISKQLYKHYF